MTSMKSATSRQREIYQIVESLSSPDCYMEPYSSFVAVSLYELYSLWRLRSQSVMLDLCRERIVAIISNPR